MRARTRARRATATRARLARFAALLALAGAAAAGCGSSDAGPSDGGSGARDASRDGDGGQASAPETGAAGLGNEGVQGYGDNEDTGRSTLDAARAMRKLLAEGSVSSKVVVLGHSQGGGAALSAQALAKTYGAGGDLIGVIGFAPGWAIGSDVSGFRIDTAPTTYAGGFPATIGSIFVYAYFANHVGAANVGDAFAAPVRASILGILESQCIFHLVQSIPQAAPTVGQLFDASFRASVLDCADGKACVDPGKSYLEFTRRNVLTSDAAGAKVLVVAGLKDTTVPPSSVAA